MSKRRILFVDDDPPVLQGLRNSLYRRRDVWDMVFVSDGEAALREFQQKPFDVVVSDMRMPVMDGAALLREVQVRYPEAIRIILSGYAENESVRRTLPVSHQFLSKPCEGERLVQVLENAISLRDLLLNHEIRDLVGRLSRLPSSPAAYGRLLQALENPLASIHQVGEIIESDASITVKVLQLVNSSYFGLANETASIVGAVSYLGVETIKMLALTAGMFAMAERLSVGVLSWDAVQRRSILGAQVARLIGNESGQADGAFTAALVRDIGQVILAITKPKEFAALQAAVAGANQKRDLLEQELLGYTHAQVGAYLLGLWGLPFPVVLAVAYHHTPQDLVAGSSRALTAVHAADALVDEALAQNLSYPRESELEMHYLEELGLTDRVPEWRTKVQEIVQTSDPLPALNR